MAATFGLDFGTTNSVVTFIGPDPETKTTGPRVLTDDGRPHPSVVWYQGDHAVSGRAAKDQLKELGVGVFGDIVRSPKMFLGSPMGVQVGGVSRQPVDVVADFLSFLRQDALERGFKGNDFETAVITIPVTMRGPARADLRSAAAKAGIRIHQFVHEPLAALYGYLRGGSGFQQEVAALERRLALVFDWGGGTLDITLCLLERGVLQQVANIGDTHIGGDQFDLRIRKLVRSKHEEAHPTVDWSRLQPSAESRLIQACEDAKIALSTRGTTALYVQELLAVPGPEKDLALSISREELEEVTADLVLEGLGKIEAVLEVAGVNRSSVAFCLATGGMVSMPAIQEGLREIFGMNGLRLVPNAGTVISEGAAWIAHDAVELKLSKPIELLNADDSYVAVIPRDTALPQEGMSIQARLDMYCVDPTDGFAKFLFARPRWPGQQSHGDERMPYAQVTIPVDATAQPLVERLHVDVTINQDLVAQLVAQSKMTDYTSEAAIHDLEFGLSLLAGADNA